MLRLAGLGPCMLANTVAAQPLYLDECLDRLTATAPLCLDVRGLAWPRLTINTMSILARNLVDPRETVVRPIEVIGTTALVLSIVSIVAHMLAFCGLW